MKRLFLILLLLFPALASGQKRVYIHKDEFRDDIYLIERKGNVEAYFELDIVSTYDSLFLLVNRQNFQEIHDYMVALRDKKREWARIARRNKVTNFGKEFDIESPVVCFRWMEKKETNPGFWLEVPRIQFYSTEGRWFKPRFSVNELGHCNIYVEMQLPCDDARYKGKYECWFPLDDNDINRIIRWTSDFGKLERIYERKKPKKTAAEINALFR